MKEQEESQRRSFLYEQRAKNFLRKKHQETLAIYEKFDLESIFATEDRYVLESDKELFVAYFLVSFAAKEGYDRASRANNVVTVKLLELPIVGYFVRKEIQTARLEADALTAYKTQIPGIEACYKLMQVGHEDDVLRRMRDIQRAANSLSRVYVENSTASAHALQLCMNEEKRKIQLTQI